MSKLETEKQTCVKIEDMGHVLTCESLLADEQQQLSEPFVNVIVRPDQRQHKVYCSDEGKLSQMHVKLNHQKSLNACI